MGGSESWGLRELRGSESWGEVGETVFLHEPRPFSGYEEGQERCGDALLSCGATDSWGHDPCPVAGHTLLLTLVVLCR